jgi:hypothetical protein
MPETLRAFVGVRDVSFTPDGEAARAIPCLDSLDEAVTVQEIVHANADGVYDVFARAVRVARRVTVHSKDLVALAELAVNAMGTLAWTLVGKGLAPDRPLTARARVLAPVAFPSGDGAQPVVGSVVLHLLSEDGVSSPIEE